MTVQEVRNEIKASGLACATKQALRHEFDLPFSQISNLTGVHQKNVTSHVYAKRGSNVRRWEDRTEEQQARARALAQNLIDAA